MLMRWMPLLLAACLLAPAAAVEFRSGDNVVIPAGQTIDDDLVISGGNVRVAGTVTGDLVAASGNVQVTGAVQRNVIVAGGNVTLHGPVGGTVYAAGGTVRVNNTVGRNMIAAGGTVEVDPEATVARDVAVSGGTVIMGGTVGRDLRVRTGSLTIPATARITRDVVGYAPEPDIAEGAVIGGTVNLRERETHEGRRGAGIAGWIIWTLLTALGLLVLGLALALVAPVLTRASVAMLAAHPWGSLLAGFIVVFLGPFAVGLLMLTVIGIPLALVVFLLWLVGVLIGPAVTAVLIGSWILRGRDRLFLALLVGVGVLFVLRLIPFFGQVVGFLALLFGLGALVLAIQARSASPLFARRDAPPVVETRDEGTTGA